MSRTGPHAHGLLPPLRRHPVAGAGADRRGRRRARRGRAAVGADRARRARRGARAARGCFVDFYVRNGPLVRAVAEAAHHDDAVEQAYSGDGRGLRRAHRRRRSRRASTRGELAPLDAPEIARALVRMLNGYLDDALGRDAGDRSRARARDGLDDLDPHAVPDGADVTRRAPRRRRAGAAAACGPGPGRPRTAARAGASSRTACRGLRDRARRAARGHARSATRSATTMVVLREPGEVFVLRHTLGRRPLRDPVTAWVERIDPLTLEPLARSPDLPAGPFWPGRHGRARQRLAARRGRQPLPPAVAGPRAARDAPRCPAPRPVQLVRRPRRRHARR